MLDHITHSGIYVLDQDEALDFYVGTLGLEKTSDVDLPARPRTTTRRRPRSGTS